MSIILDIGLALPIGIIYNILIHNLGDIFITDCEYNDKIQKEIFFSFAGSLLGAILGIYVFGKNKPLDNRAIRFGFYFGAGLLMFYSVMYNWSILESSSKFLFMLVVLIILILIIYFYFGKKDKKKHKKKEKKIIQE